MNLQSTANASAVRFQCVHCGSALLPAPERIADIPCPECGFAYRRGADFIQYDADRLLFGRFKNQFLLYKVLCNNGYVAYQTLKEGSLSLPERPDVQAFRDYIAEAVSEGAILDVGCGTLPLPGYLDFPDKSRYRFFGLDPIAETQFQGVRVIGCCEFLPFADESFDALVFATSLDHVCSLEQTASEVRRVLRPGGRCLIWMGDRSQSWWQWAKASLRTLARNLVRGYRTDRFIVYDNLSVFYVPPGAIDPFHSFPEEPGNIVDLMERAGLQFQDQNYRNRNEVFLRFEKPVR